MSEPGGGPEGDQIYTHSTIPCILYTLLLCFDPLVFFLANDSAVFLFVFKANNGNDTCFKIGISSQLAALVAHFSLLHTHTL